MASSSSPTFEELKRDHRLHDEDSLQAIDEEIALLEGDDLRSHKVTTAHVDGDATYQHEVWGFIGELQQTDVHPRLRKAAKAD